MVIERGEIWWASLSAPRGSEPGFSRPVIIVQNDAFNRSSIRTVVAAVVTSNMQLGDAPGNVVLSRRASGLPKPSVVNVSQLITLDKAFLRQKVRKLGARDLQKIDDGIRLVLSV